MSSKKVSSKPAAKKVPAKKAAEKAPAKKAASAPVKKTAAASAAKKPAKASAKDVKAAAKAAAKPAAKKVEPKKVAAKPVPKAAAKVAAKPTKKAEPAKVAKAATKAAPKATPKAAAKPAKKVEPVKKPAVAKSAPKAAAKVEAKATVKPAKKVEPAKAVKETSKAAPKNVEKVVEKKPAKSAKAKPEEVVKVAEEVVSPVEEKLGKKNSKGKSGKAETAEEAPAVEHEVEEKGGKVAGKYDYAVLLEGVKKLSKTVMFIEIDEQEDRSNKKKMSSEMKNLEMKPTSSIRHKISLAEETQEELTERILKELEEQNLAFEREAASQMCTRCNRNLVSPEFWVDKHLGYCEECAMILKLGQSKEARKVEYQLGAMGGDSLDEEDDEIMGPDADDLKEAEEDLADMED